MTISTGMQYLLTFGTVLGRTRTLRVNHANPSLSNAQVRNAMHNLVVSTAFKGTGGQIASLRRASLVETKITPIELPA